MFRFAKMLVPVVGVFAMVSSKAYPDLRSIVLEHICATNNCNLLPDSVDISHCGSAAKDCKFNLSNDTITWCTSSIEYNCELIVPVVQNICHGICSNNPQQACLSPAYDVCIVGGPIDP